MLVKEMCERGVAFTVAAWPTNRRPEGGTFDVCVWMMDDERALCSLHPIVACFFGPSVCVCSRLPKSCSKINAANQSNPA